MRLAILAALTIATPARADRCADISAVLHADAHAGREYEWGWAAGNGALAVGLTVDGALSTDHGARAEAYVGAIGSVIAALVPLVFQRVAAIDDATRLDRGGCALAEPLLAHSARDERKARGPLAHVINVAINAAGWLVIGFGWHRWTTSGLGALGSVGLGELEIYTRPTGALEFSTSF